MDAEHTADIGPDARALADPGSDATRLPIGSSSVSFFPQKRLISAELENSSPCFVSRRVLKKPTEQVAHYRPAGEDAIGNQSGIHILIQSSAKLGTGWPPVWDNVLVGARECSFVLMMMLIRTRTIGDLREVQGKHCFRAFATTFHHNLSVHWGGILPIPIQR